jgi:hypothetical protein
MKLKSEVIFNIKIIKIFIINVVIDFKGIHNKRYGYIFKREWTRNQLLK